MKLSLKNLFILNLFLFFQETDDHIMSWAQQFESLQTMTVISSTAASNVISNERLQHQQVTSTTTSRNNIMRTPEHYEMIDQIGKGEKKFCFLIYLSNLSPKILFRVFTQFITKFDSLIIVVILRGFFSRWRAVIA